MAHNQLAGVEGKKKGENPATELETVGNDGDGDRVVIIVIDDDNTQSSSLRCGRVGAEWGTGNGGRVVVISNDN